MSNFVNTYNIKKFMLYLREGLQGSDSIPAVIQQCGGSHSVTQFLDLKHSILQLFDVSMYDNAI